MSEVLQAIYDAIDDYKRCVEESIQDLELQLSERDEEVTALRDEVEELKINIQEINAQEDFN